MCGTHRIPEATFPNAVNGGINLSGQPTVNFMKGHFANGVLRAFAHDVVS